ncbi:polysaccharide export protein [Candidatus Berkiella cookevillensis]|uniref:Polysaccharide biosynthesis/export protein n=1 Tax=Candidatus Berkiella cookevillensis TaxID=437022 RepID=A0A0Q9YB85_9GAMM|nr:XrtA/PEP-CTERM system exopolysaccharide export protein [Candidatus Berkiella cookevillensis]MCS5709145.1 polysaccharide export protein [Candidatus Berkiella cookevillensis]
MKFKKRLFMRLFIIIALCFIALLGCHSSLPLLEKVPINALPDTQYHIGPGDSIQISVWKNPEFSLSVLVRPDGKISIPLIEDIAAAHKTPTQLAHDLEQALSHYLKDPIVTVMVSNFVGTYEDNIRVVGEASQPQAIPYRSGMTILDVMIIVGGLTDFADGNRATLVRKQNNVEKSYRARLDDLLREGDIKANALVLPGDVLIIPEAFF